MKGRVKAGVFGAQLQEDLVALELECFYFLSWVSQLEMLVRDTEKGSSPGGENIVEELFIRGALMFN